MDPEMSILKEPVDNDPHTDAILSNCCTTSHGMDDDIDEPPPLLLNGGKSVTSHESSLSDTYPADSQRTT